MTEAEFASRFNVRAVPVVALFDQSLKLLVEPLVGLDRSGFYEAYLSAAIEAGPPAIEAELRSRFVSHAR